MHMDIIVVIVIGIMQIIDSLIKKDKFNRYSDYIVLAICIIYIIIFSIVKTSDEDKRFVYLMAFAITASIVEIIYLIVTKGKLWWYKDKNDKCSNGNSNFGGHDT